jgi:TP901 family phage tail tape measure protein
MAATSQTQIATLYATIGLRTRGAVEGLRDFRARLGQATNNLKTMRDQAKISGAAVGALLTAPLALFGKTALEAIGDYQKAMNVFQLVTKASGAEMAQAASAIETLAHDLALPTFTKTDAAEALLRLGQAGLGARGSIEALRPALLLAAAGEVAAGAGADLLGNSLNTWGLKAADAGRVADLLAATIKFGGVSFDQLRNAVEIAGATFASAGVPMDVFLTLLAELGRAGIKGSEAGTALRNMLQSLIAPSADAGGLLRAIGVHVYDAQNKVKPFTTILGELRDAFARLTPAQQEQYAATIFGREQMGAALAIIRGGLPAYDDMHAKVTQVGIAQELAETKAKGLAGATADLGREVQNASMSAFAPMADDLAALAHGLADALRAFQALPEPVREIAGMIAILLPVLATLELAWLALGPAIGAIITVAGTLGPVLVALATGPIGLVILAVAGLAALFVWAYHESETFRSIVDGTLRAIDDTARTVTETINGLSEAFRAWSGIRIDFGDLFRNIPILREAIAIWESLQRLGLAPGGRPAVTVGGGTTGGGGRAVGFVGGQEIIAKAAGGPVTAGHPYWVGEEGPELFTPGGSGSIAPAGAGGATYSLSFAGAHFYGSSAMQFEDMVVRALEAIRREGRST